MPPGYVVSERDDITRLEARCADLIAERDALRTTSESWRKAHAAWQAWAAATLTRIGAQLDGGLWGDEPARKIIGARADHAPALAEALREMMST